MKVRNALLGMLLAIVASLVLAPGVALADPEEPEYEVISYSLDTESTWWMANSIQIVDTAGGIEVANLQIEQNYGRPHKEGTVSLVKGRTYQFVWRTGSYGYRCSYTLKSGETTLLEGTGEGLLNGTLLLTYKAGEGAVTPYDWWVAGTQVTSDNADDLTTIEGVDLTTYDGTVVDPDGYARYDAATNTLELSSVTIANPKRTANVIDPIRNWGDRDLTISVTGYCKLEGADGRYRNIAMKETQGIDFGYEDVTLTIDFASPDSTLEVTPGAPDPTYNTSNIESSGIRGDGNLVVTGTGFLQIHAWDAISTSKTTCAINLEGDLTIADSADVWCGGVDSTNTRVATAALMLSGESPTITLADEGSLLATAYSYGIYTRRSGSYSFDLQVVAEEGWSGTFFLGTNLDVDAADGYSGRALYALTNNATFGYTKDTCYAVGENYSFLADPKVYYDEDSYAFSEITANGLSINPYSEISKVGELVFTPPTVGAQIDASATGDATTQNPAPEVSYDESANYTLVDALYCNESGVPIASPFAIEAGQTYYVLTTFTAKYGSYFADDVTADVYKGTFVSATTSSLPDGTPCLAVVFKFETEAPTPPTPPDPGTNDGLVLVGTEVTSANAADIFGDGTAWYNEATNTLTLENFAATGNDAGGPMLNVDGALTINLKGENVLASGTNAVGIFTQGNLTIKGDGSLAVSGGYVPDGYSSMGIATNGMLDFGPNFTGTVVASGGFAPDESVGIFCAGGLTVRGGTVIANGGSAATSIGMCVNNGYAMEGGLLVAQGGNGTSASYGMVGYSNNQCLFGAGIAVVRAGTCGSALASNGRKAFSNLNPTVGSGMKVAAKVGYVAGTLQDTMTTHAGDYSLDTGIVIVPNSFTAVSDISSLPEAFSGDLYNVSTDGTNFGANAVAPTLPINLNGHTALFVNLGEMNASSAQLVGAAINAGSIEVTGAGQLIGVGGVAVGSSYSASSGLYLGGPMTVNGARVVAVGAPSEGKSYGIQASGQTTVNGGSFVGVGGTSFNTYGESYGIDKWVEASGTASVLGVGGTVAGTRSWGLNGRVTANDSATIVGVGGLSTGSSSYSEGVYDTATANGGTIIGVGGYGKNGSVGCNQQMDAYPGGKVVGLGGVTADGGVSYGCSTSPSESHAGDLVIAGRHRAFYYYTSDANYKFWSCANGATGLAWTDYAGTQGEIAVDFDTTQQVISGFKRVVVKGVPPVLPLYVAGMQVTAALAGDLTAIEGVSVAEGGYARYNAATNTLELKNATIANPATTADIIDPLVYAGEDTFTILAEGSSTLQGANGNYATGGSSGTQGIYYGEAALTITLVDGAELYVLPGNQSAGLYSSGICGDGTLTINGEGVLNAKVPASSWNPYGGFGDTPQYTFAFNLWGDLVLADQVTVYGLGTMGAPFTNTGGLYLHGAGATIMMSDGATLVAGGQAVGAATSTDGEAETFDLQFVAAEGWTGGCTFGTTSPSGRGLGDLSSLGADGTKATFAYTWDTSSLYGFDNYTGSSRTELRKTSYTYSDLVNYPGLQLEPPKSFNAALGTTTGGSITFETTSDPGSTAVPSNSGMNITVMNGDTITLTATPESGYRFVGYYEGVIGPYSFVDDHTDVLISENATYAFKPQGFAKIQAVFEPVDTPPTPPTPTPKYINSTSVTVSAPDAGAKSSVKPKVSVPNGSYSVEASGWLGPKGEENPAPFTFEAGKTYKMWVTLKAADGYDFPDDVKVSVVGGKLAGTPDVYNSPTGYSAMHVEVSVTVAIAPTPTPTEYTVKVTNDGNGTAKASPTKGVSGTKVTLSATPKSGYSFKQWQVVSGGVKVSGNTFTIGKANVEVKALFEKEASPTPTPEPEPEPGPGPDPEPEPDPEPQPVGPASWKRLAGAGALDTMSEIVDAGGFEAGGTVVLASLEGYWDALTAAGIAGLEGAPVLMALQDTVSAQTTAQLAKLAPKKIIVCGGTYWIPDAVVAEAKAAAGTNPEVVRLAGDNAAITAAKIAAEGAGRWSDTAIVATAGTFQDALAAAPLSWANAMPIFLTQFDFAAERGYITADTITAMKEANIKRCYIAGGTYWIPAQVSADLKAAGIEVVDQLMGENATVTSVEIAKVAIEKYGMVADGMGVANVAQHYDALAGASFCGKLKSVLLLALDANSASVGFAHEQTDSVAKGYVLGGTGSVSEATMAAFEAATK